MRRGDQAVGDAPRIEHRLGEHEARITGNGVLIQVAAVADDAEDREPPVVQRVPQRVARLEQPRALNHDDWGGAAEMEPGRHLPRLALAADPHHTHGRGALERRVPPTDGAIGHGDDVRDPQLLEERCDLLAGEHVRRVTRRAYYGKSRRDPRGRPGARSAPTYAVAPRRFDFADTQVHIGDRLPFTASPILFRESPPGMFACACIGARRPVMAAPGRRGPTPWL